MAKLFACCENCTTKRHVGCHATCEEYLADRAKLDKINAERRKQYEPENYTLGVCSAKAETRRKKERRLRGYYNNHQ